MKESLYIVKKHYDLIWCGLEPSISTAVFCIYLHLIEVSSGVQVVCDHSGHLLDLGVLSPS